jgi:hypothetical protein
MTTPENFKTNIIRLWDFLDTVKKSILKKKKFINKLDLLYFLSKNIIFFVII